MLVALAVSAGPAAYGSDTGGSSEKAFVAATSEDMLGAVQTCEASKSDDRFDGTKVRRNGWRRLSPPGGKSDGQSMFGNRSSGASITISPMEDRSGNACVIIGWVDDDEAATSSERLIADEMGLSLKTLSPRHAEASNDGWKYSFLRFTRPDVTDQVRMIVAIEPEHSGKDS